MDADQNPYAASANVPLETDPQRARVLNLLKPPSLGMLLVSGMMMAFGALGAVALISTVWLAANGSADVLLSDFLRGGVMTGMGVLGVPMFIGARRMRAIRSHRWALASAICGIIPHPFLLFTLPLSIWALIVLCRQDVREAFAAVAEETQTLTDELH